MAVVALAIQVLVFRGYYLGTRSPSGDFLGPYHSDAFAWWQDGGLLHPPNWSPYVWGGYPFAASIQDSAWYVPVGLASLFGYDVHMAASLQGLHVVFAGLGVYVLGRRAGFSRPAGVVGLVAYSLTTGFFSNAPYVDIVRGHAFAPWLLLLFSPLFPWRKWWAVPVGAVFLWQVAVGTYPGMLVAFAYGGAAWMLTWQLSRRPPLRQFLVPLAFSGMIALLLAMPKYLPLLGLHLERGQVSDLSVLPPASLGTFLLPVYSGIPGVFSLESFFLPGAAIVLACFMAFRDVAVRAALVAAIAAALLAAPDLPLRHLVDELPGIGLSRFRLNDFRPFVFLPLVIAAMSGFSWLGRCGTRGVTTGALLRRALPVLAVPAAAAACLIFGSFRRGPWVAVAVVLGLTAVAALVLLALAHRRLLGRRVVLVSAGVMVALTAASGMTYARTVGPLWNADASALQDALWGATSAQLIQQRVAPVATTQRPARSVTPPGYGPQQLISAQFNSAYYTGILSTGGYLNVQGSAGYVMARRALEDPTTADAARALLGAPGIVISVGAGSDGLPRTEDVHRCVDTGRCGDVTVEPVEYEAGHLVYRVDAAASGRVLLNEAFYRGWAAVLVDDSGRPMTVEPLLGPAGVLMLDIPQGSWRLSVTYRTPLLRQAEMLAALGLVLIVAVVVIDRRRRPHAHRLTGARYLRHTIPTSSHRSHVVDAPDEAPVPTAGQTPLERHARERSAAT